MAKEIEQLLGKTLYVVTMEIETMVMADNKEEAKELGLRALQEESRNTSEFDLDAGIARYIPCGWTPDCLIYHAGREDITLEDAMKTCNHGMKPALDSTAPIVGM